jgi:hypothetical protein
MTLGDQERSTLGTKIEPPIDPPKVPAGNLCSNRWGSPSSPFGLVTPSKFFIEFSGINITEEWQPWIGEAQNGIYKVEQAPDIYCYFFYLNEPTNDFIVQCHFYADYHYIALVDQIGGTRFYGRSVLNSDLILLNDYDGNFFGGTARIILPEIE